MGRAADRDGRGNQILYGRRHRRKRSRKAHPLPAQDRARELVERDEFMDHRGGQDRQRRARGLHREFPVDVPGLLSPFRRLHAGMDGHGQVQGPHRASASLAGGYRTQGQEGGRDRLGRDGGDADSLDRRRMRPCHHAAALADLFQGRPQRHRTRRNAAAAPGQGRMDPRDRAPQDTVRSGHVHPPLVYRAREGQAGALERYSRGAGSRF